MMFHKECCWRPACPGCKSPISSSSILISQVIAHSPTGKVEKETAPGFNLAGFSRCFSWWHFKPTKMIAGDVHLRRHHDRKIGNFPLQLLLPSDFDRSIAKPKKNVRKIVTRDQKNQSAQPLDAVIAHSPTGKVEKEAAPGSSKGIVLL